MSDYPVRIQGLKGPQRTILAILIWAGLLLAAGPVARVAAQDAWPGCGQRPFPEDKIRFEPALWCLENVIVSAERGELDFAALAFTADGTLYAARPEAGQVLRLVDGDGDGLPDSAAIVLDGLAYPMRLAATVDGLLILGEGVLYQWDPARGLLTLADDLPVGRAFPPALAVGGDGRIYLTVTAGCQDCDEALVGGAVLSLAPDGGDRRVEARIGGDAMALADVEGRWLAGVTATSAQEDALAWVDEPTARPFLRLEAGATPIAIAPYTHTALPRLTGSVLVLLAGSDDSLRLPGYQLLAVHREPDGPAVAVEVVAPFEDWRTGGLGPRIAIRDDQPFTFYPFSLELNYVGLGFWPHHPLDMAVSPEGWVYLAVGGGRVMVLRPPAS
jgi:hypothetical protein